CDIDAVTEYNGGACTGSDGGANAVDYALAEETLSSTQIATWATSSFGQAAASNLIQIPAFGIAPAIVVNDTNITTNGELELSDNDLCGIFSGRITDFSQITDSSTAPAAGKFNLVYRTDANVMSFLLTNHLNAVCTTRNTHPGVSFTATTTFASLFPGGINSIIPDAVGEAGDAGVANYLSGLTSAGAIPQAIGYVSTGWTSLYPDSQAVVACGRLGSRKNTLPADNRECHRGTAQGEGRHRSERDSSDKRDRRRQSRPVGSGSSGGKQRLSDCRLHRIRAGAVLPNGRGGQGRGRILEGPLRQCGLSGNPECQWICHAGSSQGQQIPQDHRRQYPGE
ncbi:MAG: substrate-binding domain-containing protein, partial [Steroidobacteraceae bacterium]